MQTIWLGLSNDPKGDEQKMIILSNENLKNRGNFDDYATKAIVELWHGSKDCKYVVSLMDKSLDLGKYRGNLYQHQQCIHTVKNMIKHLGLPD